MPDTIKKEKIIMYATLNDIESRLDPKHLAELADDNADGIRDTAVLEAAVADADSLIDSHLAGRYVLPFNPVPALLRRLSCDLAIAGLFARRREAASPLHEARAEAAARILDALSKGELTLAGAQIRPISASTTLGLERRFDRDSLSAY
jgi:phage gp36-like protein